MDGASAVSQRMASVGPMVAENKGAGAPAGAAASDGAGTAQGAAVLDRFTAAVRTWFNQVFASPTAVQVAAWNAISQGENALMVAPTGSGKTLAAFLWSLDRLSRRAGQLSLLSGSGADTAEPTGVRVLYISPLKALGVDVERNLKAPLKGISLMADQLGEPVPDVTVGVRSGDTPAAERNRQLRRPPDILITTPESLYLMLTSKAAGILRTVDTVIVDEIHALAGTKRGAHLAVSLERLAALAQRDPQRIGLSATVRPAQRVAAFLGGDRPVTLVAPPAEKHWKLQVHVPVEDMGDVPVPEQGSRIGEAIVDDALSQPPSSPADSALPTAGSIWPFIEQQVYQEVMQARSSLVFVNSRRTAERLTSRLNELYAQEHQPEALSPETRRPPAQLMKASDTAGAAAVLIARAHHGSVSKDERALTESQLKAGELKCVVSTSSLELGIDMGAVEQVIQVESPPSVASALQRVGRAGHAVGAVSVGSFYPKHRADLVQTATAVERMRTGQIEELKVPANALDVLTQHTVAAVAMQDWSVDNWFAVVTRAYPYRDLPREVFDSVIDLASGTYPSTDFSELRPRVNYDRVTGMLSARPGAQRVAVISGGTIPDRGMFGVFLAGGGTSPRRVGELDEEMVYESRVGDVFTLGASSWRIEEITRDQVLVTPAPGHTGRLPFWSGDQAGRPYELGVALGALRREIAADPSRAASHTLGLDEFARGNIVQFLHEQQEATGVVPDDKVLLLERFTDELGDWRIVLHSPFGRPVNAPWALAIGARIAEETGMDAQAVAGDDGIVLRLPQGEREPDASLFLFDANDIEAAVTREVGGSALFASRFRECAARALLLPRRHPGKRAPLWQQRQRAAQLLDVARKYPSFPIILETVRECLRDVYDVPALKGLMESLAQRQVRIAEVTTQSPSPFASSLLFNYTGAFMYEGDSPLAEKRAAALALDPALLAKLLGTVELRQLLDPEVIEQVHAHLHRTAPGRRARNPEELVDVLRAVGPVACSQLAHHCDFPAQVDAIIQQTKGRIMQVRIGGREHLALALDAPLLRDALGIPIPAGVSAPPEPVADAWGQLLRRFARSRGPFTAAEAAEAFGVGVSVAETGLNPLLASGDVTEGHFRASVSEREYCDTQVLKRIRVRSLAAARAQAEPVSHSAYARFVLDWQQVAPAGQRPGLRGADGVFAVVEQLAGVRLPASAWESLVLPSRVIHYSPQLLDELTSSGEVLVVGAGTAGSNDPWIMLLPADYAAELAPEPHTENLSQLHEAVLTALSRGGGFYFPQILSDVQQAGLAGVTAEELRTVMWDLVERGAVAPDGFAALRARLAGSTGGASAHRARRRPARNRLRMGRTSFAHAQSQQRPTTPPDMVGRWAQAVVPNKEPTARSVAHGEAWLDRYGVVTRGAIAAEDVVGGFALAYKVLSSFEQTGKALRGYVIEGLGAAQFSTSAVIDRLRGHQDSEDLDGWPSGAAQPEVYVVAATDPANPFGATLAWPESTAHPGARPSRSAGALVVMMDGLLVAYLTRGGKNVTFFDAPVAPEEIVPAVVQALTELVKAGYLSPLSIRNINGHSSLESQLTPLMRAAGAALTPSGVKITARQIAPRPTRTTHRAAAAPPAVSFDDDPQAPDPHGLDERDPATGDTYAEQAAQRGEEPRPRRRPRRSFRR